MFMNALYFIRLHAQLHETSVEDTHGSYDSKQCSQLYTAVNYCA